MEFNTKTNEWDAYHTKMPFPRSSFPAIATQSKSKLLLINRWYLFNWRFKWKNIKFMLLLQFRLRRLGRASRYDFS